MVSAINLDLSGLKEAIATAVKEGVEKAHRDTIEAGYVKKEQVAMMVEEAVKEVRNETQLDKNKEAEAEGAVVMRRSAMVKEILGNAEPVLRRLIPSFASKALRVILVRSDGGIYAAVSEDKPDRFCDYHENGCGGPRPLHMVTYSDKPTDLLYIRSPVFGDADSALKDLLQLTVKLLTNPVGEVQLSAHKRWDLKQIAGSKGSFYNCQQPVSDTSTAGL